MLEEPLRWCLRTALFREVCLRLPPAAGPGLIDMRSHHIKLGGPHKKGHMCGQSKTHETRTGLKYMPQRPRKYVVRAFQQVSVCSLFAQVANLAEFLGIRKLAPI